MKRCRRHAAGPKRPHHHIVSVVGGRPKKIASEVRSAPEKSVSAAQGRPNNARVTRAKHVQK
jgi:hypothetical protein